MVTLGMRSVIVVIVIALAIAAVSLSLSQQGAAKSQGAYGCMEAPGFICHSLSYRAATGNIMTGVVQDTPSNWTNVSMEFFTAGTYYLNNLPKAVWNNSRSLELNGFMVHGILYNLTVPATGPVAVGTDISGQTWARFQVSDNSTVYYTRLETVNMIAT